MRCKLIRAMRTHPRPEFPDGVMPAGTLLCEAPDVLLWVRMGIAEPADEECARQQNQTREQWEAACRVYDKVSAGIAPEDYADFDAGVIIGYDGEGNPIPGPNAYVDEEPEPELELAELTD